MSPEKTKKLRKSKIQTKKTTKVESDQKIALFSPKIEKVTINIGVGEAGEQLKKAETVLLNITKHKPVHTLSKTTNKDWGIRKQMPIGCKVTLRGKEAQEFLKEALSTRQNKMSDYSFDEQGNLDSRR